MVPGESEWDWQGRLPYRLLGDDAADVDQVIGDHAEADPALHSGIALVSAAIETVSPFDHADASLASGAPFLATAEPALPHCQLNLCSAKTSRGRMRDHTAATAFRHWSAASARKTRSVERETRWRWIEGVVDGGVHAEKTLGGASRLEPLYFALSSSHRLMRIFRPIVLSPPLLMGAGQSQMPERRGVRAQLVCDQQHYPTAIARFSRLPRGRD